LRGAFTVEESNPARILARTTERILFLNIKNERISLSIECGTCTGPIKFGLELRGSQTTV
jgi:hypothetical protein